MVKKIVTSMKYIEVHEDVFEACDGRVFNSEKECLEYEEEMSEKERRLSSLLIHEYNGIIPLVSDLYDCEDDTYSWYRLNSDEDYEFLYMALDESDFPEPAEYPAIICIQEHYGSHYGYNLPDIISGINNYLDCFGYKVAKKVTNDPS